MASIDKRFKTYTSFVESIEDKIRNYGVESLTEEDKDKVKIACAALKYAKSIALRNTVIDTLNGNRQEINDYINSKTEELDKELVKLERRREETVKEISRDLGQGITDEHKTYRLKGILQAIRTKMDYRNRVGEALVDPEYLLSTLVAKEKDPKFVMDFVISTFEETLPLEMVGKILKNEDVSIAMFNREKINLFKDDGSINRAMVDLMLSALGEGDLYKKLENRESLENKKKSYMKVESSLDNINKELETVIGYNEELERLRSKAVQIKSEIPNGISALINSKQKEALISRLNKVNSQIRELQNKRIKAASILESKLRLISSLNIRDINNQINRCLRLGVSNLTNANSEELKEALSAGELALIKERIKGVISETDKSIKAINIGLTKEHRNLSPSLVSEYAYPNISSEEEMKARERLKTSLRLLQDVDTIKNSKAKSKNILTSDEENLIVGITEAKIKKIMEDDEYALKM